MTEITGVKEKKPGRPPLPRDQMRTRNSITMPAWMWDALSKESDEQDSTVSRIITRMVRQHLTAYGTMNNALAPINADHVLRAGGDKR